jgi:tetratricopeptide (TPR) repeat protein
MRSPLRALALLFTATLFCASVQAQEPSSAYEKALAYVRQGNFDQAVPLLEEILRATPDSFRARDLLGIALSSVGRKEEGNVQFRKALEIAPNFAPVLKNLALNELSTGQYNDAEIHFQQALKTNPQDPALHFGLGEVDFALKEYAQAISHYDQCGELYLKDPQSTLRYAESALKAKKPAAAVAALDRLTPEVDAKVHFEAGLLLAQAEQYQAAARHFQTAAAGYPDPYVLGYNLVLTYQKASDNARAIETGEQLLARGYRKAELYNLLAQSYEPEKRTKDAYNALRSAAEIEPRDENNYVDLVSLCVDHENYDLALEISNTGLAAIPQSYRLRLERGMVLALKGRLEDAERECELAAKSSPQESLPVVVLALIRFQMNKVPEAIQMLRERHRLNQNDYLSSWFLGDTLSRQRPELGSTEEKEAVLALEDAVRVNPNAGPALTLLGKLLVNRGDLDRAASAFERALQVDPEDTAAAYQLAFLCRKKGDTQRANELFAKVSQAKTEDGDQTTKKNLVRIIREGSH